MCSDHHTPVHAFHVANPDPSNVLFKTSKPPSPPPLPRQGCVRHPSFGYVSDMKALRCSRHRLENMEGVKGRRKAFRREGTATAAADVTALPASGPARRPSISSSSSCFSSDSTTPGAGSNGTSAGPTGPAGDHDCNLPKPAACRDETRGLPPSWLSVI